MKYANLLIDGEEHLCYEKDGQWLDISSLGTIDEIIAGKKIDLNGSFEAVTDPVFSNIVNTPGKLVCVGLNYKSHADKVDLKVSPCPILFSKYSDALVPANASVELPEWETSYDYEAELVIVIGKQAWGVSEEEAMDYIFGFTCGNDLSVRDPQMRTSQWLIGKTMPGFGPCGPCIATRDEFQLDKGKTIKSYVNHELRQNGNTNEMISSCAKIVSYASKYIRLEPGDLIFTGTPSGVALEKTEKKWLKKGDIVEVEIEDIGKLVNRMI